MLKKLSLAAAIALVCGHSYAQDATKPEQPAKFTLTNNDTVFNFCEIEEGDVVKHEFLFQNTGSGPLFINNVHSDLKNAKFRWPSRIIKPGKTGIILVTYSSFMDVGSVAGDIYISSNATKEPITPLHIKGTIRAYEDIMKEECKKSASK